MADRSRPLTDAELVALAALAQCDALGMDAENKYRLYLRLSPNYMPLTSVAIVRLETELRRRGVL